VQAAFARSEPTVLLPAHDPFAEQRYLLQCGSWPGTGLPMRATGMKKHIWPIATVSFSI
jgi:hypothetical protein